MSKKLGLIFGGLALCAGAAIACNEYPIPPMTVEVGTLDIAEKWWDGYDSPANAAFREGLDDAAKRLFGNDWRNNSFKGEVISKASFMGAEGRNLVYVEKPCGEEMIDGASKGGNESGQSVNEARDQDYFEYVTWFFQNQNEDLYGEVGPVHPV